MPLPFDAATIVEFARGLAEVFVIEEKQPNIELLVKDALYSVPGRPTVVGKRDELGLSLVPGFGGLEADSIVAGLRSRLEGRVGERLAPSEPRRTRIPVSVSVGPEPVARAPFYCSGCPHNRSTEVPDGALVGAGIGCHTMTLLMDPERVGDIAGLTPMGNEGTQWIGMAPFVDRAHFIQNLGDGTYFHSGQLAVTAAIAAGVNITYKLLYNDAVAMTGGQAPQGRLEVAEVAEVLLTQGVAEVLITTDQPRRYRHKRLPAGVRVWDRTRLIEAQEYLADVPGVTVLIHDQACAAELRRARRRGTAATPTRRVVINHRVCEGCGDCGEVSNCLSVQPLRTEFGRKTQIDQTSCNFDESCLEGDCPSFITVETDPGPVRRLLGHRARRAAQARLAAASPGASDASSPEVRLQALLGTPSSSPRSTSPPTRWRCALLASAAQAWSPQPRCSARPPCSMGSRSAASTRWACRRRPARSSATCASPEAPVRPPTAWVPGRPTWCWPSTSWWPHPSGGACRPRPPEPSSSAPPHQRPPGR